MSEFLNGPDPSKGGGDKAVVNAQLMQNPYNAMYNDRVGGLGDSVGNRADPDLVATWNDPMHADRMRWDGKYLPGFQHAPGTNPFAWVERISQADVQRQQEVERDKAVHHEMMRKGRLMSPVKAAAINTDRDAEAKRMARCQELEKKLGVDKVVLDPMKLQIDTTAWGVLEAQDKKRAAASGGSYTGGVLPRAREKTNTAM